MGLIVLVVIFLLLVAAAAWYIPKARRRIREERERRLKVAQGIFDEEDEGKRKRKRKKRRFSWLSTAIELPPRLKHELANNVPDMINLVLAENHATTKAGEELAERITQFEVARDRLQKTTDLSQAVESADNLDAWLARCIELTSQTRQATKACCEKHDQMREHNRKLTDALDRLKVWLNLLNPPRDKYDFDELSPELKRILELARVVEKEIDPHLTEFDNLPERLPEVAEVEDDELEASVAEAYAKAHAMVASLVVVSIDRALTKEADSSLDKIRKDNDLIEPEKPVEDDVSAFMNDALEWAESLQDSELAFSGALDKLGASADIIARDIPFAELAANGLATLVEAKDKAKEEERFRSRRFGSLDERPGDEFRPRRRIRARPIREERKPVVSATVLTESQACRKDLIEKLIQDALSYQKSVLEAYGRWDRRRCPELTDTEISNAEKQKASELTSLIRKLGFAIAQLRNVRAKLEEASAKSFDTPAPADLDADDAERFIQQHQRWRKDSDRLAKDKETHSNRVEDLKAQQSERFKQLIEAAKTLERVVSEHLSSEDAFPCSHQLDVARRASSMAAQQFKQGLQTDKDKAAEDAAKAEAKRRKARQEEEERRRKRRRSSSWGW